MQLVVAGDSKTDEAKQWIQNTLVTSKRTNCRKTNFCRKNQLLVKQLEQLQIIGRFRFHGCSQLTERHL
jgi:hypothetical protein